MPPAALLPADETARRIRAAIGYSLKEHREIQKRLKGQITPATLKRISAITNPRPATHDERIAVADACGVPRAFMEDGFKWLAEEEALKERVAQLQQQIDAMESDLDVRLAELRSELRTEIAAAARTQEPHASDDP